jgi:hypothetical protein
MNFKKEELQEMLEKQLDGVATWLQTVNAQALTIKSQQTTIREQGETIGRLEEKNIQLRRKLAFKEFNERQREKEMN